MIRPSRPWLTAGIVLCWTLQRMSSLYSCDVRTGRVKTLSLTNQNATTCSRSAYIVHVEYRNVFCAICIHTTLCVKTRRHSVYRFDQGLLNWWASVAELDNMYTGSIFARYFSLIETASLYAPSWYGQTVTRDNRFDWHWWCTLRWGCAGGRVAWFLPVCFDTQGRWIHWISSIIHEKYIKYIFKHVKVTNQLNKLLIMCHKWHD